MSDLSETALTIRPFLPAADFGLSKRFYADLGFEMTVVLWHISQFR